MIINLKNPEEIKNTFSQLGYKSYKIIPLNKFDEGLQNKEIVELSLISNTNNFKIYLFKIANLQLSTLRKVAYKLYNEHPTIRNLLIFTSQKDDVLTFLHYQTSKENLDKLDIKILEVNPFDIKATDETILKSINIKDLKLTSEEIFRKHIEAFKVESVCDEFFKSFDKSVKILSENIEGISSKEEKDNYAVLVLSRLVFLYFIQKKGWLNGEGEFLYNRFLEHKKNENQYSYYDKVLKQLFFCCLNTPVDKRKIEVKDLYDNSISQRELKCTIDKFSGIPYLNGGLFQEHKKYNDEVNVKIKNEAFTSVFDILLNKYNFTVKENYSDEQITVDPELLGKIYEHMINSKEKSISGSFYTPKILINYMCKLSINQYLKDLNFDNEKIKALLSDDERDYLYEEKYYSEVFSRKNMEYINNKLKELTICDFAVGSGAFILGMLQLLVKLRLKLEKSLYPDNKIDIYDLKKEIIEKNLYGVDINEDAIEICHLRLWLSLAVDSDASKVEDVKPLPNFNYKIMVGNTLVTDIYNSDYDEDIDNVALNCNESNMLNKLIYKDGFDRLIQCKNKYFNANENKVVVANEVLDAKRDLTREILKDLGKYKNEEQLENILENESNKYFAWSINFPEIFIRDKEDNQGFHIVIGNPPYVSVKSVKKLEYADKLEKQYKFKDDLYNYFTFRGMGLIRNDGHLNIITSNTFLKLQSKKNMRNLLQKHELKYIIETPKYFKALVNTAIFMVKKKIREADYKFAYSGKESFSVGNFYGSEKENNLVNIGVYRMCLNNVFFVPSALNIRIYDKYNHTLCSLFKVWGPCISDSKKIRKNKKTLDNYRKRLKPGDITLLGLITEGGQGLATGDNGRFIGVLENTIYAEQVKVNRIENFYKKVVLNKEVKDNTVRLFPEVNKLNIKKEVREFFNEKTEEDIDFIFTKLKTEIDKDIFGQGFLYRIITKEQLADVETLSDIEKRKGIEHDQKVYVPYDKGDKEGNRWYLDTPYYINWSKLVVSYFIKNSGKKGKGMPVVRNKDYYFEEGICWSDIHTLYIKCRAKGKSVHDVKSMSIFATNDMSLISSNYLIGIINSNFINEYVNHFINNTSTFQINDARQLPIIIPNKVQLNYVDELVDRAIVIRKKCTNGEISKEDEINQLQSIQNEVDEFVYKLYGIDRK